MNRKVLSLYKRSEKMSVYTDLGLKTIINGSGKMTALGGSTLDERVSEYIKRASSDFVDMDELINKSGEFIARYIGAEDVCVTSGAAAGIAISVAAMITKGDLNKVEKLPSIEGANHILIQKGQAINFGAPVTQMIRLGGGTPIEVGQINQVSKYNIENSINENVVALLYIKSHHCVQKGMVSLEDMLEISRKYNIPTIADCAAEEDLGSYLKMGVDLIIYSGGKAISGPTSGFIAGRKELVDYCKLQYQGIGRAMKLSKENIMGLVKSIELYYLESQDEKPFQDKKRMKVMMEKVNQIKGLESIIEQDEAGREIYRLKISVDEKVFGMSAKRLIEYLENGDPSIYTRNHYSNIGLIYIDPRPLKEGHEDIILDKLVEIKALV